MFNLKQSTSKPIREPVAPDRGSVTRYDRDLGMKNESACRPARPTLLEEVAHLMRQAANDSPLKQEHAPAGKAHPVVEAYWRERAFGVLAAFAMRLRLDGPSELMKVFEGAKDAEPQLPGPNKTRGLSRPV